MSNKARDSILDFVGNTPLIKLNKIPRDHGVTCEIYAKCEFLNPCGSIKDRIALGMIRDAQRNKVLHADTTLVEATSGNTGIGIAFNCALLGNKCTIVTEEKNSAEKVNTIRLLGADVIQVNNNENELNIAHQLRDDYPQHIMLNQFDNNVNPKTHYKNTGTEIVNALDNMDMVVMGAGTGGTLTGVGIRIKEEYPNCKIVAAEPDGSTLFNKRGTEHVFLVEGIGGTWAPIVLDTSVVDEFEAANDEESFLMARELSRKEGLLCGASSGTAVVCAIKAAKRLSLGPGKRVVVILPDGIRNYMTKFVSDQWMEAHLFMDPPQHTMTRFLGAVSKDGFRNSATNPTKLPGLSSEEFNFDDPVTDHLVKHVRTLDKNGRKGMPTVGRLSRILDITPFVVIGTVCCDKNKEYFTAEAIATGDDILDYIYAIPK